jgi:hypothetical protein
MPIAYYQLHPMNAAAPGYAVAIELASQVIAHFGAVRGSRVGIGPGSCCAAVAVQPGGGYFAAHHLVGFDDRYGGAQSQTAMYETAALPYAIVYGNSQLTVRGLDMDAVGGHAERVALNAARTLYVTGNNAVLFVELTPCGPCQQWLANIQAFQGFGAPTLNVWWRWEYPDWNTARNLGGIEPVGGLDGMVRFHGLECQEELNQVINDWGPGT